MLKLVILFSVFTVIFSDKPGDCPPQLGPPACELAKLDLCKDDDSCLGILKCCKNECGGAYCLLPFPSNLLNPKPEEEVNRIIA